MYKPDEFWRMYTYENFYILRYGDLEYSFPDNKIKSSIYFCSTNDIFNFDKVKNMNIVNVIFNKRCFYTPHLENYINNLVEAFEAKELLEKSVQNFRLVNICIS